MNRIDRYDSLIRFYAEMYNQDRRLMKAQIKAESNFNPYAESPAGAKGLCQFMQPTFDEWAKRVRLTLPDVWNPEHQIHLQAAYLQWLGDQLGDNPSRILAAYNYGIGHIKKGDPWPDETVSYVDKILADLQVV